MAVVIEPSVQDLQKAAMGNMFASIDDTIEVNLEETYGKMSNWIIVYDAVFEVLKGRDSKGELINLHEIYNKNGTKRSEGFILPVHASIIKLSSGAIDVF